MYVLGRFRKTQNRNFNSRCRGHMNILHCIELLWSEGIIESLKPVVSKGR